jgi:hypothetical protein
MNAGSVGSAQDGKMISISKSNGDGLKAADEKQRY